MSPKIYFKYYVESNYNILFPFFLQNNHIAVLTNTLVNIAPILSHLFHQLWSHLVPYCRNCNISNRYFVDMTIFVLFPNICSHINTFYLSVHLQSKSLSYVMYLSRQQSCIYLYRLYCS